MIRQGKGGKESEGKEAGLGGEKTKKTKEKKKEVISSLGAEGI